MTKNVESLEKNETNSIVNLKQWKTNKEQISEAETFKRYLNTLALDALIEEVKVFTREIESTQLESHHVKRGKLIIDEISKRMAETSPQMIDSIMDARRCITKTLSKLDNLSLLDKQ